MGWSSPSLRKLHRVLFLIFWQGGFTQIKCNTDIFIGGVPNYDEVKKNSGIIKPFSGSIQKVQAELSHVYGVTLTADKGIENCDQCANYCSQNNKTKDFEDV